MIIYNETEKLHGAMILIALYTFVLVKLQEKYLTSVMFSVNYTNQRLSIEQNKSLLLHSL